MKTQNSNVSKANKSENKGAAKQQSNNTANTTRRVVETRDQWQVIFDYSVSLIAAYCRNQKPSDPRSGFGFGLTTEQPHSRAYAKSLIWGFSTNKAGKVLKNFEGIDKVLKDFEGLDKAANREKIAIAILSDCKLVKGETKDIMVQLNKVEPKRERMIAESVLAELTKPTEPTTPKGGKGKGKSQPKAEKPATKGGKTSAKPAAPKGSKAKAAQPEAEDDVVVYNYIHFGTDYGVVTIPTLGKTELEYQLAFIAYKRYLKAEIEAIRKDEDHDEATLAELNDTLKGAEMDDLTHLGWSNEVTPSDLGAEQIVILKDNKKAKSAWHSGVAISDLLNDLTPLKGWKAESQPKAEKATTKGGNGKKSTTKGGKAAKK